MRISEIHIKNLRSFKDVVIPVNPYTCFVGPNGAGKSTILCALNIFFRETSESASSLIDLTIDDFHRKQTDASIEVTVTFTGLSDEAKEAFEHYVRHDKLIISAIASYDDNTKKATVEQWGQRLVMRAFEPYFAAEEDGALIRDLKPIYQGIRQQFADLPDVSTGPTMKAALKEYEGARPAECELSRSRHQFYGATKGTARLERFVQWVYIPAVKDAGSEQNEARNSAIGKLVARTVRSQMDFSEPLEELRTKARTEYQALLDEKQNVLERLSTSLQNRLAEWAHPDARVKIKWRDESDKAVRVDEPTAHIQAGEGGFDGDIFRFGHGLQRSYLLALLQELALCDNEHAPTLILGCEEPELYQHPPQARHLSSVLKNLSGGNTQVFLTTHSPYFISGEAFEDVRLIRKNPTTHESYSSQTTHEKIAVAEGLARCERPVRATGMLAKIHQSLQPSLCEMFFTSKLVLVESHEDAAYISAQLHALERWDEFRAKGGHIVSTDGKSEMIRPLIIAKALKIPCFVIFDADSDKELNNTGRRLRQENDNRALFSLLENTNEPFPNEHIWATHFVCWSTDIGQVVQTEMGQAKWEECKLLADQHDGQVGNLNKNPLHISACLTKAWQDGHESPSLRRVCEHMLAA